MGNILKVIGLCIDCKHYEYRDSKAQMGGGYYHWGYCHREIPFDTKDPIEQDDLSFYFQVLEDDFCSKFKAKDENGF